MSGLQQAVTMDTKSSISVDVQSPEKVIDVTADSKDAFYEGVLDEAGVEAVGIDPQEEKKLLRKLDLRIIPGLWILFLCAFVDRINIGNARIQGLEKDLKMKGNDYNMLAISSSHEPMLTKTAHFLSSSSHTLSSKYHPISSFRSCALQSFSAVS